MKRTLTPDQIAEIKSAFREGATQSSIAARLGVKRSTIGHHTRGVRRVGTKRIAHTGRIAPSHAWQDQAGCTGYALDTFFPQPTDRDAIRQAFAICADCPVAAACLDYAVKTGSRGIWGGKAIGLHDNGGRHIEDAA